MIPRRVVRRYAAALFSAARKAGVIDRVESDLGLVSYVLDSSPALADAIESPVIPPEKKHDIIRDIFGGNVHEITLSYLLLLVDKRREEAIRQTEEEYIKFANKARGIVDAEVTTAVHLDESEETRIQAKLNAMTGKQVRLIKTVDPNIIGGVLVRIGDTVIDGSIKGQLAALREQLLS